MNAPLFWVGSSRLLSALAIVALFAPSASAASLPDTFLYSLAAPAGTETETRFGESVATDGIHTVVGAPGDDTGATDAGSVRVFDSATGELRFTFLNPNPEAGDQFGAAVAIAGSLVVVGAPRALGLDDVGLVYVYDLSGKTPVIVLSPTTGGSSQHFGSAVAISGTRIVVGVPDNSTKASRAGNAYVFDVSGPRPDLPIALLYGPNPEAGDRFGAAVTISGSLVVVGAPTGSATTGRAFLYDVASATPTVSYAGLINPDPVAGEQFAVTLSMSGTRVLVGAPGDSTGAAAAGSAYLFEVAGITTDTLNPITTFHNPAPASGDHFGSAVALSGSRVLIGAALDDAGATDSGTAYVFNASGGAPVRILDNPKPGAGDTFGAAVALSGTHIVVGVPSDSSVASEGGNAYLFSLNGSLGYTGLNTTTQQFGAAFGTSVGIAKAGLFSDTDTRIVVGMPYSDAGAMDSGRAFVYFFGSTNPVLRQTNPNPFPGDTFGSAVAAAESRTLVGAPYADLGGVNAGAAYQYIMFQPQRPVPARPIANPAPGDHTVFGRAVAADGNTNVIAAAGKVYVNPGTSGVLTLNNPTSTGDEFGYAVGVSGTRVIVGAPSATTGIGRNVGTAYVYDTSSATPEVPVFTLPNPAPGGGDRHGFAVAIAGRYAVVGAPYNDTAGADAGIVSLYDLESASPCMPIASWRNPAGKAGDQFGFALAIVGNLVVVGAPFDQTYGADSGAVYLYDLSAGLPTAPAATLRNPRQIPRARFGYSVASEGSHVVVGAPFDGIAGADNGAVYIFAPDTAGPVDGTLTLFAPEPVEPGAWTCVFFDDWKDPNGPLTYVVMIDGVAVNTPTTGTTIHFAVPTTPGVHQLTGCIFDARGNVTEVPRTFTVKGVAELVPQIFGSPGTSVGLVGEGGTEGYLQATIQRTGAISARLVYEGKAYAFSGKIDAAGVLTKSIARTGKTPLQVSLRADWSSRSGVVTADVTDGSKVSAVALKRSAFTAANPAPEAGRYTILIEAEGTALDSSAQPVGFGSGILVVSPTGRMGFAGRLADGTPVAQTTWISEAGTWPLYIPLYSGTGAVAGNVTFRDRPELTDLDGALTWRRPAFPKASFYKEGFTTHVALGGSRFTAIPSAFTHQRLTATLSDGNLPTLKTASVPAFVRNVTRSGDLTLNVNAANGLLTGSFLHPVTHTRRPIFGAVFPKLGIAAGYFSGKNQTGDFQLTD